MIGVFFLYAGDVFAQPIIKFSANQTTGCGAVQVIFLDSTIATYGIKSWKWDLGGVTSDKQNPGRIYDKAGSYKICLTVTDTKNESSTLCKDNYINIYEKPSPNFLIDKNQGCTPLTVNFTDISKSNNGKIVEWIWDIGGSANVIMTSDPLLPISSTYNFAGQNSMALTIKDEKNCEATISKKDILLINSSPILALQKKFLNSCELPWRVEVTNANADINAKYFWDFGNGQTHNGPIPPIVTYNQKGSYDLKVTVQKGECKDIRVYESFINTNPKKEIKINKSEYCIEEQVAFKDESEVGADSIKWTFGDGSSSLEKSPFHSYKVPGCYQVKLFRWRGNCKDTVIYDCVKVLQKPNPSVKIDNQFTCYVPINIRAIGESNGQYEWTLKGPFMTDTSTQKSAIFVVDSFGSYQLFYTFTNGSGCKVESTKNIEIKKFEANLPRNFVGDCVPYNVVLNDSVISEVPIIEYQWTIGNPPIFTSNSKVPTFKLNSVGVHDTRLIVKNAYGCIDTIYRNGYVQGGTPPTTDFYALPKEECLNVEREYRDSSSSNANFWRWDFGDTQVGFGKNVKHYYSSPGTYDVTLTAMHNGCATSKTYQKIMKVLEPISAYKIEYQCDEPHTIKLQNLSLGADSLYWEIYNGVTRDTIRDSLLNSYTFPKRGDYTLSVYSKNFTTGCEHIRLDTIKIRDLKADYAVSGTKGCMPYEVKLNNKSIDASVYKWVINEIDTLPSDQITYLKSGKFKLPMLLAIDVHNCRDSMTMDSIVYVNDILPKIFSPETVCVPGMAEIINKSIDSFAQITDVKWIFNSDTIENVDSFEVQINKSGLNKIFLKLEDSWGCKDSIAIDAVEGIELKPDFISDTLGCTNADILFLPSGDNVNTSKFKWEIGSIVDSTSVLKHRFQNEGSYDVCLTLFDIRGCENTICKPNWINIRDPKASFSGDPLTEVCPPLLTNFRNNSINAIAYQWDFGDNTGLSFVDDPSHIYTEPDTFDVTLVAIRSEVCKDTLKLDKYVTLLGPRGSFSYEVEGNCLPLTVNFKANSDDYYKYYWDFGNGVIDSSDILSNFEEKKYEYTKPGIYSPKLIISDNNGCARNFSQPDVIVNKLDLNIDKVEDPICSLPAYHTHFNKSVSTSQATNYTWKVSLEQDTTSYLGDKIDMTLNKYGNYNLLLIGKTDNCIDSLLVTNFVNVNAVPKLEFKVNDLLCEENEMKFINESTIDDGTIDKFLWDINGNIYLSKDAFHKFEKEGLKQIQLIGVSRNGCTDTLNRQVEVFENNKSVIPTDTLICIGQNYILKSLKGESNPAESAWFGGGQLLCSNCEFYEVSPQSDTRYTYYLKQKNGCEIQDSFILKVAPEPVPNIILKSDTTLCLNVVSAIEVDQFDSSHKYVWQGIQEEDCINACRGINILPKEDTYFRLRVFNKYGCFSDDSIFVKVEKSVPDFLINDRYICEDNLTVLKAEDIYTHAWYDGSKILCNQCDSVLVNPQKDKFYKVITISSNKCQYEDSVLVHVIKIGSLEAGNDHEICLGEVIILNGEGFGKASWTIDSSEVGSNFITEIKPEKSSFIKLSCLKDECTQEDSLYVTVLLKSVIEGVGDTVCFGDKAELKADGEAFIYEWYKEDKLFIKKQNIVVYPDSSTYMYVVGKRTTCAPDTQQIYIKVHPEIEYKLMEDDFEMYYNTKTKINAEFPDSMDYQYEWFPSNGLSCDDCPEPVMSSLSESVKFTVNVTDKNTGCAIESEVRASLNEECSKNGFYIPNIIDANSYDQYNSYFSVKAAYPEEFLSIMVSDRWGNMVYSSQDINQQWDLKFNGKYLEVGVYTYVVKAICTVSNEEYYFSGDITFIR